MKNDPLLARVHPELKAAFSKCLLWLFSIEPKNERGNV